MGGLELNRRQIIGGLAATAALSTSKGLQATGRTGSDRPNIIFIMADDLGFGDLGCTGSRIAVTPNIDKIAQNGLFLRQGYANSSMCSPTRTALLSGCYQHRFEVGLHEPLTSLAPEGLGLPFEHETIAEVLKAQGYETALVGKWHLGDPEVHTPLKHGYDHFFGIYPGGVDYFRHRAIFGGRDTGPGLHSNSEEVERAGYLTDLFGDEAVSCIRQKSKPLFLSLHFTAPHWPWEGREDEEVARKLRSFFHYDGGSIETYYKMISAMDENIGKVFAALEEMGELENSIIVFTSDNGGERFSDVWPFTGMKGELLEGGIRVPILMQWPRHIAAGQVSQQVMTSMDFLPTLASMAGGKVAKGVYDGMDLSAQIMEGAAPVTRTLFWRMKAYNQAAIRRGDWKYFKINGQEHLFNLAKDERERAVLNDLHPEILEELKLEWDAWNREMLSYPLDSLSQDNKEHMPDRY